MSQGKPSLGTIPKSRDGARTLCLAGQGPLADVHLRITQDRTQVGRSDAGENILPDVDLGAYEGRFPARALSRRHAEIARSSGGWSVVDLQSSNGTFLGDRRLTPGESTPLPIGALVRFGQQCFRVEEG